MHALQQALIEFFERAARKDDRLLRALEREERFRVDKECWCFTLPDLYGFLQRRDEAFSRIDYKQFRKLVFNSPVNRAVKASGAEITIRDNRMKVDRSGYALVWSRDPD